MFAYAANNPVHYTDPDGEAAYSWYNENTNKYDFIADPSRTSEICSAIYGFVPFANSIITGIDKMLGLEYIGSSSPLNHRLAALNSNNFINSAIDSTVSVIGRVSDSSTIGSFFIKNKIFAKFSSCIGNVGTVLNFASLYLSVDNKSGIAEDLIIEALYGSLLSSDTRKGVEDKYLIARDNLSNLMNDGSISYSYGEDNKVHLQINDYEKVIKSTENLKNMD